MQATCKRFHEHCRDHEIALEAKQFSLRYDSTIPRQTGLSGSSAIVCAALNCLMDYYGVRDRRANPWPVVHRAQRAGRD